MEGDPALLESGTTLGELSGSGRNAAKICLVVRLTSIGAVRSVDWNQDCRRHGLFVLEASKEKNGFEFRRRYLRRENIKELFRVRQRTMQTATQLASDQA